MTVIIAGSRDIWNGAWPPVPGWSSPGADLSDLNVVMNAIDQSSFEITEVRSGLARGVDSAALMKPWACLIRKFPANWKRYGKQAGYLRNEEMERGDEESGPADGLIAITTGSPGTRHMINIMVRAGKPVEVQPVKGTEAGKTNGSNH